MNTSPCFYTNKSEKLYVTVDDSLSERLVQFSKRSYYNVTDSSIEKRYNVPYDD